MAERRMFAKTIIDSDVFLEMPLSTQALYFHLAMRADDEGFLNNPKRILRTIGAAEDDLRVLIARNFILIFETGIIVIRHWKVHNYIQADRFKKTSCIEERALISVSDNVYSLDTECIQDVSKLDTKCIQDAYSLDTQVSLGKDSLGKDSLEKEHVAKNCNVSSKKPTKLPPVLQTPEQDTEAEKNAIPQKITNLLKPLNKISPSPLEIKNLVLAAKAGCTQDTVKNLLRRKPAITGFSHSWQVDELMAQLRIDKGDGDDIDAELERRYGKRSN